VRAVQVAGADLAYVGTPFIATHESLAADEYKQALCTAGADDIVLTDAVTGIPANFLASSLKDNGIMNSDGSLLPTSLGVNPQETIMAVATVLAERMATRHAGVTRP
jgi:NAD(P)H-dependent flavin oxidoreductase YrpB (nitropropane dioxygenase family)